MKTFKSIEDLTQEIFTDFINFEPTGSELYIGEEETPIVTIAPQWSNDCCERAVVADSKQLKRYGFEL